MSAPREDLIAQLPSLIAARIATVLPDLRDCKGMVGGFDVAELKRKGFAAPAVLVSRLGIEQHKTMAGPHRLFAISMAAFIVTRDAMGLPRDIAAANIASALLRLIPDTNWGEAGVGPAEAVEERVLVTRAAREVTASLSAVIWRQPVALEALPASDPLPIQLYLGQAPKVGPGHEGDYDTIGEPG